MTSPNINIEGAKYDQDKPRYSLLEWDFIKQIVYVLEFGAKKYTEEGWKQVPNAKQRYWDAAMRHLTAIKGGEFYDEDSGLPHYAHVAANCMFLAHFGACKGEDKQPELLKGLGEYPKVAGWM